MASTRSDSFSLSVGDLVATSIAIYVRNLIPFTLLAAIFLSPWVAMRLLVEPPPVEEFSFLPLLEIILTTVLTYMLTGALTYGVVMQLRGKPASFVASFTKGMSSFLRVFGTGLICALRITIGLFLLVIPGIIESIRLYVAIPAAVMEGKVGNEAARRSIELVKGNGWTLFFTVMLVFVLVFVVAIVVGMVIFAIEGAPPDMDENPSVWLEVAWTIPIQAFGAVMYATAYFLLRKGKEDIEVAEIAKIFD